MVEWSREMQVNLGPKVGTDTTQTGWDIKTGEKLSRQDDTWRELGWLRMTYRCGPSCWTSGLLPDEGQPVTRCSLWLGAKGDQVLTQQHFKVYYLPFRSFAQVTGSSRVADQVSSADETEWHRYTRPRAWWALGWHHWAWGASRHSLSCSRSLIQNEGCRGRQHTGVMARARSNRILLGRYIRSVSSRETKPEVRSWKLLMDAAKGEPRQRREQRPGEGWC